MATRQPTKEEFDALSKDLQDVLIKHNAEIGVTSAIELMIRTKDEPADGSVVSPFVIKDNGEPGNKTEEGKAD